MHCIIIPVQAFQQEAESKLDTFFLLYEVLPVCGCKLEDIHQQRLKLLHTEHFVVTTSPGTNTHFLEGILQVSKPHLIY